MVLHNSRERTTGPKGWRLTGWERLLCSLEGRLTLPLSYVITQNSGAAWPWLCDPASTYYAVSWCHIVAWHPFPSRNWDEIFLKFDQDGKVRRKRLGVLIGINTDVNVGHGGQLLVKRQRRARTSEELEPPGGFLRGPYSCRDPWEPDTRATIPV